LLLGEALEHTTDDDGAVEAWQAGYEGALRRGDLMVANEMKAKLVARGAEVPEDPTAAGAGDVEFEDREPLEGEVRDARTGRVGAALAFAPFPDAVGEWIQAHITGESWEAWMEMSIKVINELRLDLGDPEHQAAYDQHMQAFLNVPAEVFAARDA
ncbi:MAG: Fe(2+)-trafficking protein, partial [Myxococcales bacterium]|nr:Fe(2+)-trafficking protein [Myxococcales bacterium]